MFASNVFGFVLLAALMAVVSSEVYALLHAVHYAVKQGGGWRVGMARYEWASPLLHERASADAGREPAYRASRVVGVFAAAATVMAFAGASFYVAVGAAVLAACAFGAAAYGKAFVAHRSMVSKEIEEWRGVAA
jgi:hypothetical protein